jgi:MFS family permease
MVGPLLGGWLLIWLEWQWLFLAIQILAILALGGLWFVMPKDSVRDVHALEPQKMIQGYRALLQNKVFVLRCGTLGLIYASLIAWITGSPSILMIDFNLSTFAFGLCQSPIFGCYILGAQIGQRLINRFEGEKIIRSGIQLSLLGVVSLLCSVVLFPHQLWGIVVSMSVLVLGAGIVCAPLNRACFQSSTLSKGITSAMFYTMLMGTGTLWSMVVSMPAVSSALPLMSAIAAALVCASFCYKKSVST